VRGLHHLSLRSSCVEEPFYEAAGNTGSTGSVGSLLPRVHHP
jgi:hypothetical protein